VRGGSVVQGGFIRPLQEKSRSEPAGERAVESKVDFERVVTEFAGEHPTRKCKNIWGRSKNSLFVGQIDRQLLTDIRLSANRGLALRSDKFKSDSWDRLYLKEPKVIVGTGSI